MDKMNRVFASKKPFIGFLVGGDGGLEYSVNCALALIEGGVDILEIGFPFSDPVADGPVIQRAAQRALSARTDKHTMLEIGRRLRSKSDVPLILFSYYNPLLQAGPTYLKELKSAGFDGVLVVDLPFFLAGKEGDVFLETMKEAELHPIFILTPSTKEKRIAQIASYSTSFLYYACRKGTTGVRSGLPDDLKAQFKKMRHMAPKVPIVVGFGIAERHSACQVLDVADGFVVGSQFVKLMEKGADPEELKACAISIAPRDE